ncbi:MAG: flagellar biosynthetic protein FliO [Verrucomicrobia bacterium]|nr:flagellar biosynthetic protein FliO [Verrucomicrobiota bacterium]
MLRRIFFTCCLTCHLIASPSSEEILTEAETQLTQYDFKGQLFKLLLTASLLIAGLAGGAYAIKRLGRSRLMSNGEGGKMRILIRRPLSPKSALYLIETEGYRLLVGDSQHGGLRTLLTLPPKQETKEPPSFREILEQRLAEKNPS